MKACYEVLKGQGVGMSEPLVDDEGISCFSPQHLVKFLDTLITPAVAIGNFSQCFGFGLDPDSIRSLDPDPNSESGF